MTPAGFIALGLGAVLLTRLPTSTIVAALGSLVFWEWLWPRLFLF